MNPQTHVIGFANKYFTLWEKGMDHWYYVKNISMDEETAKAKYPGLEINLKFRGTRPIAFTKVEIPPFEGKFTKGRHKGIEIEGSQDEEYMKWYVENGVYSTNEEKEAIIKEVEKFGNWKWEVQKYNYVDPYGEHRYGTIERFEKVKPKEEVDEIERVLNGLVSGTFEMFMEKNLDGYGNYTYYDKFNNWYAIQFENFKEMYYAGYSYGLPMLNGKSKRVKNKTLRLTEVEQIEDKKFIVKNFEII